MFLYCIGMHMEFFLIHLNPNQIVSIFFKYKLKGFVKKGSKDTRGTFKLIDRKLKKAAYTVICSC